MKADPNLYASLLRTVAGEIDLGGVVMHDYDANRRGAWGVQICRIPMRQEDGSVVAVTVTRFPPQDL